MYMISIEKIIFFIVFTYKFAFCFDFYNIPNIQRVHSNIPHFIQQYDDDDVLTLAKKYNIHVEHKKIWEIKKEIYKYYMKGKNIYIISIDGTICHRTGEHYLHSIPDHMIINSINKLHEHGHEIHYYTSRGSLSGKDWSEFTYRQLQIWGVKYNTLNIGKPYYNYWIDSRAININNWDIEF